MKRQEGSQRVRDPRSPDLTPFRRDLFSRPFIYFFTFSFDKSFYTLFEDFRDISRAESIVHAVIVIRWFVLSTTEPFQEGERVPAVCKCNQ